jgi:benzoyl-CoA reductase subunit B
MAIRWATEPLKLWKKAKELRLASYESYAKAHDRRGVRWVGSAWALDAIPAGLGDDVWCLASEPYAASIAADEPFSTRCQEAAGKAGLGRDICSYMRTYWGSVLLNEYAFPSFSRQWPAPDFILQSNICTSHAKWHQVFSGVNADIPQFCIDVSTGPAMVSDGETFRYSEIPKHAVDYVVSQCLDAIDWMQEVTGRPYQDDLLRTAILNHMRSTTTWARICELQKNIPAPLDEKSMLSLYVLAALGKASGWCADFYDELYDEVKDRTNRGIAAVANERARIMTDTQPPWAQLNLFRRLEEFGCVSIGSLYTFGLIGQWDNKNEGAWGGRRCPMAVEGLPGGRREMLEEYVRFELNKPQWQHFYHPKFKSAMMIAIARQWKLDGIMLHFNRGCEGLSLGIAENKLALEAAGFPVMAFEGNMCDGRENDTSHIMSRIDMFMEQLGLTRKFTYETGRAGMQ